VRVESNAFGGSERKQEKVPLVVLKKGLPEALRTATKQTSLESSCYSPENPGKLASPRGTTDRTLERQSLHG
jgi:hypothetical protein